MQFFQYRNIYSFPGTQKVRYDSLHFISILLWVIGFKQPDNIRS